MTHSARAVAAVVLAAVVLALSGCGPDDGAAVRQEVPSATATGQAGPG